MLFALEAISSLTGASGTAASNTVLGEALRADPPAREHPDAALLGRIAAGDREAFRVLVERHADKAFGLCLRILRNQAAAEAVVRETMLEVWTNGVGGAGDRLKFSIWLCRAMLTLCAGAASGARKARLLIRSIERRIACLNRSGSRSFYPATRDCRTRISPPC
jgi:RNA polymerase sigma-70 factor (ECF subfamily)